MKITNRAILGVLMFVAFLGIVNLIGTLATISPLQILQPTEFQTALASLMYSNPYAQYFASLGINTTFFHNPLLWIYRLITTGITDTQLIQWANTIEMLSLLGLI